MNASDSATLIEAPPQTSRWWGIARSARDSAPLLVPLAFYTWLGFLYLPQYQYQINPDGVCYMSIAQKYLGGRFANAINAYWSPLYCWLLVPLLAMGVAPVLATKVLGLLIGGATLGGLWLLGARLKMSWDFRLIVGCAAAPALVWFVMQVTTPDLLVAAVLVFYLAAVVKAGQVNHWRQGMSAGALGAVAYLAKAYALPFVLVHFALSHAVFLWQAPPGRPRREVLKSTAAGLLALLVLCGIWAMCLSVKYGRLMTGSTGAYNHALNGPESRGQPTRTDGFLPPPDPGAVSAWDDPTDFPMPHWSPFESWAYFWHQWDLLYTNFWNTLSFAGQFTWLLYPILLLSFIVIASPVDPRPARPALVLALALLLYPCGYWFLHVEVRFLFLVHMLLLLLGAFAVYALGALPFFAGPFKKRFALLLLCISFLSYPIRALNQGGTPGEEVAQLAEQLQDVVPAGSRIATDDQWQWSLYLSFYNNLRFHGQPRPGATPEAIEAELHAQNIEYLYLWGSPRRYPFLSARPNLAAGKATGVRIYRLSNDGETQPVER